jgi:chitodextrinase
LVNQTLSSINPSSITSGAATAAPAQIPLACNPLTQTIPSASAGAPTSTGSTATTTAPASLSAGGGTLDVNGNTPTYHWSDTNGATSAGSFFSDTFTIPGTYTVTLGDSTGDASTTCTVIQQ